ncbi:hypothetical protein GDO81_016017 [Engystomops pustulosus]|uniref:Uncharacterized protein n=1 Tax=Engystomops pustulosus TaxID=76066 RepID=A0AAV7ATF3_ENGPU|nr:hypothetical protein GDO81_016017 [Engystomops pustulosus]
MEKQMFDKNSISIQTSGQFTVDNGDWKFPWHSNQGLVLRTNQQGSGARHICLAITNYNDFNVCNHTFFYGYKKLCNQEINTVHFSFLFGKLRA